MENPNERYWTIVQHCKGLGVGGISLPRDALKLFRTTVDSKVLVPHPDDCITIPLVCSDRITPQGLIGSVSTPQGLRGSVSTPQGLRPIIASFIGSLSTHPIRQKLREVLFLQDGFVVESGDYKNALHTKRFEELMSQSIFALCPRGVGSTSFRLVEAMQLGCIPVYISDEFSEPYSGLEGFPQLKEYCICVDAKDVARIPGMLRRIAKDVDVISKYRENISRYLAEYFTIDGCCRKVLEILMTS
jgi:glycosyltransferase involved in cell wall biosynthesis